MIDPENGQEIDYSSESLKGVHVWVDSSQDSFIGNGYFAHSIGIRNSSEIDLSGCNITINSSHESRLEDLEVYYGFWRGNEPRGKSSIFSGESIAYSFSHDNNNYLIMKAPGTEKFSQFGLHCNEGFVSGSVSST